MTSSYEPLSIATLEAMSCGIPVIATDSGSTKWVLGGAGITVQPYDKKALTNEINKMLEDEDHRGGKIIQGYERIKDFPYETWGSDLYEIIRF